MASSSSALCEDQLLCCICLDVFTDPVSTPCGHNFCMICLKEYWDSSSHCQCPVCKEEFSNRPDLRVNTFISALAASFKKPVHVKSSRAADQLPFKSKKVLCDSCTEDKLKALKSCLHCGVSLCNTHLIPHKTTPKLMKHKLMEPVENLEDYICQKHERPLELFCRDDQTCVCQFCTEADHKTHNTVPIEEESAEKKNELVKTQAKVQQKIQERLKTIEEIKHSVEVNKKNSEKEKADVVEMFSALIRCIERSQAELLKVMEENQKAAERQAEEFIKDLEQEISELKRRNTDLEQLSHTEDHLYLLQIYPLLCSSPHTQDWTSITMTSHLSVETLRRALAQLQETLSQEMEKIPDINTPQKVGVFVDYEEGLVSFYDVDAKSHIYSFTAQTFTEKLYPYFCPCTNDGVMASSSSALCEDQLHCCICLDVFTDPVSTPCGHNFCMICLKEYWDSSPHCQCPVCKEEFSNRPDLRVNTFISALAATFKKSVQVKSSRAADQFPSKGMKVLCDACAEDKLKALKSCLHCGFSLCNTHLMPHKTTSKLMKHKLMEPVENLEDYICQKHERPLELFCRDDQTCVCQFCTEGDHKSHNTVSIEEESVEKKNELLKTQAEVQQKIQERLKKIEEIKHSVEVDKKNSEKEKADVVKMFSALIRCIERSQAELLKVMEVKQKAAEKQAEEFIKDLEQELSDLKRRNTDLEQLSHTEDHLHLLQIYPSLCSSPHTKDWTSITITSHLSVETLRRALAQLQETLGQEMEKIDETVDVTLDPDTANPYLILSDDGKQVTNGDKRQNLPDNPERFNRYCIVLGKKGFSSGRFYYEVQVKGKTKWDLGVARESINRKGEIRYRPEDGFWCVVLINKTGYTAFDSPCVSLSLKQSPQKVGVFVDYEEGLVSFYDVDAKSHIYSFTAQTFTEKLYPYFCPDTDDGGKNSAPLIICPVHQN
ncbi:bloodthirsty-relatedprotein family, member 6 [Silurus meridionalis]|nr:bloodthirsty-relatedprotein family, member 6 [Silurus meridionalis]